MTIAVDLRRKSSVACFPSPTSTVTATMRNETESIRPDIPVTNAPSPTTASQATNGKTAAAVQSTEAALYPMPHRYMLRRGVNRSSTSVVW